MLARRSLLALGVFCLMGLSGCTSDDLETSTVFDPLSRFPASATYRWDDTANKLPSDERVGALDLDPLIHEAANQEFAKRGYRVVHSGPADYRLSYQVAVNTWLGPDDSNSLASLSLMLVDVKQDRRVWLGYGRAEVHVSIDRAERLKRLQAAVAEMLAKFPPS